MAIITQTSDRDRESLRRSALAVQGPSDKEQSWESYYGSRLLRNLGDPQDPTKVSFPFLRRMRRDHLVSMGLHFIQMPIVKSSWYFEADDAKVAAFADNLIRPIYGSVVEIILRYLWSGYSPAAKNFMVLDKPGWTYYKDGVPVPVWDQGNIGVMVYKEITPLKPENALPTFDSTGAFNGIAFDYRYSRSGGFVLSGNLTPNIDLLHSMWAVHDKNGEDGNPFGFPRIAHCAPIFHMFRFIWTMMGRAFENSADPGPVVRYPNSPLNAVGLDGKAINNVKAALKIGSRRRSGSTIAMSSETYTDYQDKSTGVKMWDIEYPDIKPNFDAIMAFIGMLESMKLRGLWLQEVGLIETGGSSGGRNAAAEFGQQRDASQAVLMQQVVDVIVESLVKAPVAMNFPQYNGKLEMKTLGFGEDDEDIVRQIFQLMGQRDDGLAQFGIDVRRLAESRGFPMMDQAEQQKLLKQAAEQAQKKAAPAVTPTQGRRAFVTQTGFDRETREPIMSYVQLDGEIVLSADDDFILSLPRTDTFADRQVVAATRSLRNQSNSFLAWMYADFATFMGKQKTLDISAELAAVDEEFAGDKVRKVVDDIMARWRPRVDRISEYRQGVRSVLGRVFDRTSGKVKGNKLSSIDKSAAAWLNDRGAEAVQGILNTTRQQIAEALADGVRAQKAPKEIASDIREHFGDFPAYRASMIARTEISSAYNFATVSAGINAGIKKGQLLDGNEDKPCKARNGKIVNLIDALKEKLAHPNCTFCVRLLPNAPANLEVRVEQLEGVLARYDEDNATVLLSVDLPDDDRATFLISLGDHFTDISLAEEALAA